MSTLVITLPLGSPQAPADYSYTLTVDGHNATQQASASAALLLLEQAALRRQRWNVTAAAVELGIARATVYRQMKRFGIVPPNQL